MAALGALKSKVYDGEERKQHYKAHIRGLNALERHHKFINDYVKYYGKHQTQYQAHKLPLQTDQYALRQGYRFIRSEEDDMDTSWEQRLVKRYYDKLFKEYCIADMSMYKTGKIGLRWRTEKEVIAGKGQFICGNKHCDQREGLASFEVNFSYFEAGENKQALVKLVACERCAEKLHYRRIKEKELTESRQNEDHGRKREMAKIDDDINDEHRNSSVTQRTKQEMTGHRGKGGSKRQRERSSSVHSSDKEIETSKVKTKKGKRARDQEDDENFDVFMDGMFP